ncbi:MAG: hypothetical protein AB8V19_04430, partial [Candidatus Midichloria sp.]
NLSHHPRVASHASQATSSIGRANNLMMKKISIALTHLAIIQSFKLCISLPLHYIFNAHLI